MLHLSRTYKEATAPRNLWQAALDCTDRANKAADAGDMARAATLDRLAVCYFERYVHARTTSKECAK